MQFKVIEIDNPRAVHAICDTRERAQYWMDVKAPAYVAKGYFDNKALTPESFTIVEE